ncbi:capsule biosynthesis protein [Rhabdaerophilum sp. SD176]|uniref:capsule biosynthesis protein n=1 Tax=Rhabdaerophilum sp. SD176 TaxID=2983548 RepID=UPI0024DFE027|nr:capsule biosynthesis protein [Rhabdaerophilum sp. SD176]
MNETTQRLPRTAEDCLPEQGLVVETLPVPALPPNGAEVEAARRAIAAEAASPQPKRLRLLSPQTWPKIPFYPLTFVLMVLIPAFMATFYLAFLASDQFQVEARFAVRSAPSEQSGDGDLKSALTSLTSGGTPTMATQDAYIVASYLQSRAAIQDLEKKGFDLKGMFRRSEIDFYARLKAQASAEDFDIYWKSMVSAAVDGPSGIVTLFVRAFQPEDAKRIAQGLIEVGESLVNTLSDRARQDTLLKAEEEVRRAELRLRQALVDLRRFRDQEGFLDPVKAAGNTSTLMLNAMSDRIKTQNDLFVAERALGPNAPSIVTLRARLTTIDQQIDKLKGSLTSTDATANPVSAALLRYEELEVQRIFAEKLYGLAQNGLERARQRADKKQIYISVFVPPLLPEEARFPERITYPLIVLAILIIVWGIFALTCAAVEDHLY